MAAVVADEDGQSSGSHGVRPPSGGSGAAAVERAVSALVGYTMGAVVVLPFDRVKALTQMAAKHGRPARAIQIARAVMSEQGIRGFYQGAQAHMLIAPYTMFYYSVYSQLLAAGQGHPLAPLAAAVLARSLETVVRMPLELVRTQMQAADGTASFTDCIRAQWRQPPSAWLRGCTPTLLRDVPFSAIYWFSYEHFMLRVRVPEHRVRSPAVRTFLQGYCCGAAAGMVAALVTTPTDVVKTVRQHGLEAGKSPSYNEILAMLRRDPRLAFAGIGPRLVRIPLGLSTMMSGLELTKWAFEWRRSAR